MKNPTTTPNINPISQNVIGTCQVCGKTNVDIMNLPHPTSPNHEYVDQCEGCYNLSSL